MAVRLSALSAGRPLSPGRFLVLISIRGSRAIVQLEGLGQFKNPVTSSGIQPATFQLFRKCDSLDISQLSGPAWPVTGFKESYKVQKNFSPFALELFGSVKTYVLNENCNVAQPG
jgi:hypothetical protein